MKTSPKNFLRVNKNNLYYLTLDQIEIAIIPNKKIRHL